MAKKSFDDMTPLTRKILMAFQSGQNQPFTYIKTDIFGNRHFHKGFNKSVILVSPSGHITSTKHEIDDILKRKIITILEDN